jgi:hypothetical protein
MAGGGDGDRALYPRLMGPRWEDVPALVRGTHLEGERLEAEGTFRIRRGRGPLRRAAAALAGVPADGDGVPTRLKVTRVGSGERWHRTFSQSELVTWQRLGPSGELEEQYGPWRLRFHLHLEAGTLRYVQQAAAFAWGRFTVPLPRWLAPRVEAREAADEAGGRTRVDVEVRVPLLGTLVDYGGTLRRVGR